MSKSVTIGTSNKWLLLEFWSLSALLLMICSVMFVRFYRGYGFYWGYGCLRHCDQNSFYCAKEKTKVKFIGVNKFKFLSDKFNSSFFLSQFSTFFSFCPLSLHFLVPPSTGEFEDRSLFLTFVGELRHFNQCLTFATICCSYLWFPGCPFLFLKILILFIDEY